LTVFEVAGDSASDKIRCKECLQANPKKTDWITRAAAKRHVGTAEHAINVAHNAKIQQDNESQQRRLMESYSSLTYPAFDASLPDIVPHSRANLFDADDLMLDLLPFDPNNDDDDDDDDGSTHNIFAPLDNLVVPAGVEPLAPNLDWEIDLLQREVELLQMSAEHADEVGNLDEEEDITLTNVTEHFRSLGEFRFCIFSLVSDQYPSKTWTLIFL
jgi:hypothetical protein